MYLPASSRARARRAVRRCGAPRRSPRRSRTSNACTCLARGGQGAPASADPCFPRVYVRANGGSFLILAILRFISAAHLYPFRYWEWLLCNPRKSLLMNAMVDGGLCMWVDRRVGDCSSGTRVAVGCHTVLHACQRLQTLTGVTPTTQSRALACSRTQTHANSCIYTCAPHPTHNTHARAQTNYRNSARGQGRRPGTAQAAAPSASYSGHACTPSAAARLNAESSSIPSLACLLNGSSSSAAATAHEAVAARTCTAFGAPEASAVAHQSYIQYISP